MTTNSQLEDAVERENDIDRAVPTQGQRFETINPINEADTYIPASGESGMVALKTPVAPFTQTELKEMLHFDPGTGVFIWKKGLNRKHAKVGAVAGSVRGDGSRVIGIGGRNYTAARLAVLYMTGDYPGGQNIYRANGKPDDIRWTNLLIGKQPERIRTGEISRRRTDRPNNNNKIGLRGVSYSIAHQRFQAAIFLNGKQYHLGFYDTPEEAHDVYCDTVDFTVGAVESTLVRVTMLTIGEDSTPFTARNDRIAVFDKRLGRRHICRRS